MPTRSNTSSLLNARDKSRFGLHTIRCQRITARGSKPIGIYQHRFENTWVFGAVEPATDASHFMEFPRLDTAMVQQFLDDFARANPEHLHVILMDNARSHTAKTLVMPTNVVLIFQPPYSTEVNPCERVLQAIKAAIAWEPLATLDALRQRLIAVLMACNHKRCPSLLPGIPISWMLSMYYLPSWLVSVSFQESVRFKISGIIFHLVEN